MRNKPLPDQIAQNLIDYILENNLQIGDKIPNEYLLAESLGVGRSTIREAVKILVSRNILEIRHGAGTFLSKKQGIADDPLGFTFIKDKWNLALDLLSVRFMLEPEIAEMAAKHATEEQIEKLRAQCRKVEELIQNDIDHTNEDVKFHRLIAECSKNVVVEKLIPVINSAILLFINVTNRSLKLETIETHREIVNAIYNRDSEGAKYAMTMHLIYNRRLIIKLKEEQESVDIIKYN